jgi:hypothetical protein
VWCTIRRDVSSVRVLVMCLAMYMKRRGVQVLVGSEHGARPKDSGRRSERRDRAVCRGRLGLISLVAYTEGSQACLMAHFQRLARPPPSCPSYHGHGETWDREGGLALGASPTDW